MHDDQIYSDIDLVRSLLEAQLPQRANLPIEHVESTGTDNALYRLGSEMVVHMPLRPAATGSIEKEHLWLPLTARHASSLIPVPRYSAKEPTRCTQFRGSGAVGSDGNEVDVCLVGFGGLRKPDDKARHCCNRRQHRRSRAGSVSHKPIPCWHPDTDLKDEPTCAGCPLRERQTNRTRARANA